MGNLFSFVGLCIGIYAIYSSKRQHDTTLEILKHHYFKNEKILDAKSLRDMLSILKMDIPNLPNLKNQK